jgi:hypothetical protein
MRVKSIRIYEVYLIKVEFTPEKIYFIYSNICLELVRKLSQDKNFFWFLSHIFCMESVTSSQTPASILL